MNQDLLRLIKVNRDAPYVNRGFYFQYLLVLEKWLTNFIDGNEIEVFTEVGNDIKEVGEKLVYTQVKCYTTSFSLRNATLKKEIFNFFTQYLEEKDQNPLLEFHFYSNSTVAKNDKLLRNWIDSQPIANGPLRSQCCNTIKAIVTGELNRVKRQALEAKNTTDEARKKLKQGFSDLKAIFETEHLIEEFTDKIIWSFGKLPPEEHIDNLHSKILTLLNHPKFEGKPHKILMEALLSEIYRCSQLKKESERKVNNRLLSDILQLKDEEIKNYINTSLLDLIDVRFHSIRKELKEMQSALDDQADIIGVHSAKLNILMPEKKDTEYPADLTLLPYVNSQDVLGRQEEVDNLARALTTEKHVVLTGEGGIGKTTLAKTYVNTKRPSYDHIIWISCEGDIITDLTLNVELLTNLNLDLNNKQHPEVKFRSVLTILNKFSGTNLLVFDNIDNPTDHLEQLKSLRAWHILLTTRARLPQWQSVQIPPLNFEHAKKLYKKFEPVSPCTDDKLKALFEFIEYNTLIIELLAKTIHSGLDLSAESMLYHLSQQSLDDEELELDITNEGSKSRLLNILLQTFQLAKLPSLERYYMELFALLPSDDIYLSDLVLWYGKEYEKNNRRDFTNIANSLHEKGFITRDGDNIRIHKMLQESILYRERKSNNPFITQTLHIAWLATRLQQGAAHNPSQAMRMLKYGETILSNIKDPYRDRILQPLLILENEVLNILFWLKASKDLLRKWEDLVKKAELVLPEDDPALGAIFNNYALALIENKYPEEGQAYLKKSIAVLKKQERETVHTLLTALCNHARLYIQQNDFKKFGDIFEEISKLRTRYNLWEDSSLPYQSFILGLANEKAANYKVAIQMYNMAINTYYQLREEQKNDLHLVIFLNHLAICYLLNREVKKSEKVIALAVQTIDKTKIQADKVFSNVVSTLLLISEYNNDQEAVEKLSKILTSLQIKIYE